MKFHPVHSIDELIPNMRYFDDDRGITYFGTFRRAENGGEQIFEIPDGEFSMRNADLNKLFPLYAQINTTPYRQGGGRKRKTTNRASNRKRATKRKY